MDVGLLDFGLLDISQLESLEGIFFLTLRCHGALPEHFGQNLGIQFYSQQLKLAHHPEPTPLLHTFRKRLFARFDEELNLCKYGHAHFNEPERVELLSQMLADTDIAAYKILKYSILPNHLHLLIQFKSEIPAKLELDDFDEIQFPPLRDFVADFQRSTEKALKNTVQLQQENAETASFQKQNLEGQTAFEGPFWHTRSFDFQITDAAELKRVVSFLDRELELD